MDSPVPGPALAGRPLDPVEEAMRGFGGLQTPELHVFLGRVGLTVGGTKDQRLQSIAANLGSGAVPTDTAFDFLDERRECGEQHVFLFRLQQGAAARLAGLRDETTLLDFVAAVRPRPTGQELGEREVVRQGLYEPAPRETLFFETEVDVEGPLLVAAYWRGAARRELFLKWVETRRWQKLVKTPQPVQRTHQERAVHFFHVDLESGHADLRVQKLHPAPESSLEEVVATLRGQLAALLGDHAAGGLAIGPFLPVPIEPAMRRLLSSEIARVVSWQVDWMDSGKLGGGVDPALAQCLFRRHREFSALRLTAEWLFDHPGGKERKVPVQLDGRTNEVTFPKRCTAGEMRVVADHLRQRAARPLRVRQLQELRKEDETATPILLQIERELGGRRDGQTIDLRRLARETWLELADVIAVTERLADRHPEEFSLRYVARCEVSGNLAELPGGGRLEVRRWADVPETFQCIHQNPKRIEQHDGPANVEAILETHARPPATPPLQRIQPRLEQWFGKSVGGQLLAGLAVLAFSVVFLPVVLLTTLAFLALQRRFADGGILLSLMLGIPMALLYVLEAGAIAAVLGEPLTSRAQQLVGWVFGLFSWLFERRADDDERTWPAKVHRVPKAPHDTGTRGAVIDASAGDEEEGSGDAGADTDAESGGGGDAADRIPPADERLESRRGAA